MVRRFAVLCHAAVLVLASSAHAQIDNKGVLDQALKQFRTAAESWQNAAENAATTLFWSLAIISFVWTMGHLLLRRAELGELFGEVIRYALFTGFWFWMLSNGPSHASMILDSMVAVAGQTVGQHMVTPSAIVDIGFHLVDRALTQSSILSPLDSAFGIAVSLVILVVLALVAVNMLVTVIACWIVAYGGLIVLGFGGCRWTSDMAINYYKMVLSLALQVMAMVLIVGIGEGLLRSYYSALEQNVGLHEQAVLLVVAIVLLVTVNRVPSLLGSLANGSSPQYALGGGAGFREGVSAASTAFGATALATGGTAAVLGGVGRGATSAVGAVGEVMAAQRHALADMHADFGTRAAIAMSGSLSSMEGGQGGGGSVFPAAGSATRDSNTPSGIEARGINFGEHERASSSQPAAASEQGSTPRASQEKGRAESDPDRSAGGDPETATSSRASAAEPSGTALRGARDAKHSEAGNGRAQHNAATGAVGHADLPRDGSGQKTSPPSRSGPKGRGASSADAPRGRSLSDTTVGGRRFPGKVVANWPSSVRAG